MDGYYAWMIVATALVLMMTTPALALFYGGMTRAKSVLNMMMMSYIAMAIVGIVYVLWGWSMSFAGRGDGTLLRQPVHAVRPQGRDARQLHLRDVPADLRGHHRRPDQRRDRRPGQALRVGGVPAPVGDALLLPAGAHGLQLHWTRLICTKIGAQDYAGGTAVHINAGVAGLVLALIIGRRVGFKRDPMRPHSLPLTMIGAGLLWVGWYGFNVGSIVFGDDWSTEKGAAANVAQFYSETGRTFTNTTLATMAAMLGWLVIERLLHGKATTLGAASGIVAGLVAITPACGAVDVSRRHRDRCHRRWCLCLGRRAEVQVQPRRLARRRRRPPGRRHRGNRADRPVLHLRRARAASTACSTAAASAPWATRRSVR